MTSMEAAEREFNSRVAEIEEDDDLTDEEKARQIDAARSRYSSALATALDAETDRREAARETYLSAETAAVEARSDATEAAVQARATAKNAAKDAYDDAVAPLQEAAQDAIDDIYERPGKRRQDARDDYDDAIAAARNQRDAATDAARDAFDTALHSLTVDGNPILPDHAGYLQDTSTFPYRTLTPEAYDEASQAERSAFNAAFNAANSAYNAAVEQYNAARRQASYDYWLAKKGIGDIREDARCRWSFTPEAIDSDRLSLPTGDNPNYSCMLYMAGIEHFDVVYKPKSLTGADFSQYYAELEE
jgi:hypothetical protein